MSIYQEHLDEEALIVAAIKGGSIDYGDLTIPDHHIETGLAHIFFFGERVFKQYKIVSDADHFIKGVLAPTEKRHDFLNRDFVLNQHFSGGVYKTMHSHSVADGIVSLDVYAHATPHVLLEMERLDFSQNFHEQLLRGEVTQIQLYTLGHYTAQSVAQSPVSAPEEVNWYELASKRIDFLEQFIAWLPEEKRQSMEDSGCVASLRDHLEVHEIAYTAMVGNVLSVTMDNHDENIFFRESGPVFIDVVPPMESWWYGSPSLNLANISVNVETLMSKEAATKVEEGYLAFHMLDALPEDEYRFNRALALAISAVHFSSLEDKGEVGNLYIEACKKIPQWL